MPDTIPESYYDYLAQILAHVHWFGPEVPIDLTTEDWADVWEAVHTEDSRQRWLATAHTVSAATRALLP